MLSRAARTPARERGFTLIEVIVSITLLALAAAAVLPLLITAARAAASTKYESQGRALGQERVERMRNLQYNVDVAAGPFVDMLDTYYPNTTPPAVPAGAPTPTIANVTSGQVAPGAARLPQEFPAGQGFYRYVVPPAQFSGNYTIFKQIVNTQFLAPAETNAGLPTPVMPPSSYSRQTPGADSPPTGTVRVRVITTWRAFNQQKSAVLLTDISNIREVDAALNAQGRATAMRVSGSVETAGSENSAVAGEITVADVSAAIDLGATAQAVGSGGSGAQSPGNSVQGAKVVLVAPPTGSVNVPPNSGGLLNGTCQILCFGRNTIANAQASVVAGAPSVGTAMAPLTTTLNGTGAIGNRTFEFNPLFNGNGLSRLRLAPGEPAVSTREVVGGSAGTSQSTGLLQSNYTAPDNHNVKTTSTTRVKVVSLLPTEFTPLTSTGVRQGLVEVEIESASLSCEATATGGNVTGSWTGVVRYWTQGSGYVEVPISSAGGADPLANRLDAVVAPSPGIGPPVRLGEYIAGWASLTSVNKTSETTFTGAKRVTGQATGIVNITTQPLRQLRDTLGAPVLDALGNPVPDPDSNVFAQIGILSCLAEDGRK